MKFFFCRIESEVRRGLFTECEVFDLFEDLCPKNLSLMYLQTYVRMYIWGMLWNFSKTGVPRFESGVFDNLCLDCDVPEPFGSL